MRRLITLIVLLLLVCSNIFSQKTRIGGRINIGGKTNVHTPAISGDFPSNGILDNFNRSNEGPPPSSNWTTGWRPSATGFQVDGNAVVGSVAGDNNTYWNTTFGPNCEVYAIMVNNGSSGTYRGISARLINVGTSNVSGYEIVVFGDQLFIQRIDNNAHTTLGAAINQTFTIGDSVGMKIVDSTITAYYKVGVGAWIEMGSRTDSTYSGAGKIGLRSENMYWDDFGGGNLP